MHNFFWDTLYIYIPRFAPLALSSEGKISILPISRHFLPVFSLISRDVFLFLETFLTFFSCFYTLFIFLLFLDTFHFLPFLDTFTFMRNIAFPWSFEIGETGEIGKPRCKLVTSLIGRAKWPQPKSAKSLTWGAKWPFRWLDLAKLLYCHNLSLTRNKTKSSSCFSNHYLVLLCDINMSYNRG